MIDRIPPMPGTILAPCKTRNCDFAFEFGSAFNTLLWIERFEPRELSCPLCKVRTVYSRDDLKAKPREHISRARKGA
jgi:hypothetical protein